MDQRNFMTDLKALDTQVPYWAIIILFVSIFFSMEKSAHAFLVLYFALLVTCNKQLWRSTKPWLLKTMQTVVVVMLIFVMTGETLRKVLE